MNTIEQYKMMALRSENARLRSAIRNALAQFRADGGDWNKQATWRNAWANAEYALRQPMRSHNRHSGR